MANVCAQPAACMDRQSGVVLPIGHGAWLGHGLRISHAGGVGFWFCVYRTVAKAEFDRPALGRGWLGPGGGRDDYRDEPGFIGQGIGVVHVLSAHDRQSVFLYRHCAGGSRVMIWVALMSINLRAWKKAHPGEPIPLAMFANVTTAYLWAWTSLGAAIEILFLILPVAVGLKSSVDAGLARVFFSWTLHAIVYFWLMPAYIAFYTLVPRAIGGRLYSDVMGRVAFVLFLVFSMPIGVHHLFQDPQVGSGIKFLHAVFTGMVTVPTLLTVFTICASGEIAGRLRGGKGLLGWIKALPWNIPMMLAVAFSFFMLGFGGAGGIINMSYQLDFTIHNTQWITGHFHLIFGGAIVIMYFAIAYDVWPHLTGKSLGQLRLVRTQLWLWFIGMLVVTFPWHYVSLLGMPRRMAYFDYSNPAISREALAVSITFFGGLLLLASGMLFVFILARAHGGMRIALPEFRFSRAVHPPIKLPLALNGFGLWLALMIGLTVVNYGFPIAQLIALKQTSVPAVFIGAP